MAERTKEVKIGILCLIVGILLIFASIVFMLLRDPLKLQSDIKSANEK